MTTSCPTCGKPVDPLRSRFAGVLGGKIVAYCSAACAGEAPRAAPPAEDPRVVTPATGVPVVIQPPPAGVPVSARTPVAAVLDDVTGPPRPVTPAPGVPINLESGPVIEIVHEPASGVVPEGKGTEGKGTEGKATEGKATEGKGTEGKGTEGEGTEGEGTEGRGSVAGQAHPGEPSARSGAAENDSGAVRTVSAPGSVPVELPGAGRNDAPGRPAAVRSTAGAVAARRGTERAPSGRDPAGEVAPARTRRTPLVLLVVLAVLVLGAGGFLAYQYLLKHDVSAATRLLPAPSQPAARVGLAGPPGPAAAAAAVSATAPGGAAMAEVAPVINVAAAVEQARGLLQASLTATSQRLSRLAAAALARTRDAAACETLAVQIGFGGAPPPAPQPETSEIAKLDLAYALARCADPRGKDVLAAALGSQRADVRDEAARLLALLGDRRAVPHLVDVLEVSQRRLGAAEHLAHLAEPHALKVLEQIRGDARASAGDKARATVALGIAGHADVAAVLRAMLGDSHENAFAAAALAELKDGAARPVLEHQLESPVLRVRAARALRRLDPALDPRPLLPRLLDVLKTGRDVDQIQAAEAILILAGPASWSSYE